MCSVSCEVGGDRITLPALTARVTDSGVPVFTCLTKDTRACSGVILQSCKPAGEFLQSQEEDCGKKGGICDPQRGCIACAPGSRRCQACAVGDEECDRNVVQECNAKGTAWEDLERCDLAMGDACFDGRCQNMCAQANQDRSYVGCVFYAADLDNAAIDDQDNASAQQFAVAVANPQAVSIDVDVEINDGEPGNTPELKVIDSVTVPPGALEVFELPRREVDGSTQDGLNDGTHTALTSRAFRVTSSHPMIAYQFNPLENSNVFSNDASLLLPTSAIDRKYTVVSWPQTIGSSENPEQDFDPTSGEEDLRAFLTIIGTKTGTAVDIELGSKVVKVVGAGLLPESGAGDMLHVELEPFDVLNLETEGFNADFTGTLVNATEPVTVFVGSEASDVPMFGTLATRQCCADHLEEQLIPDASLGSFYSIARMPPRTKALAASAGPDDPLNIAEVNEPEWVRVIATAEGITKITTTLPPPDDSFQLA
ncbi:MAG TPA: IgGFc-binding protein, partial [Polyangiales bacterium]|nr:IgGFc-binding protein [Polyangiales bacterium]